MKKTIKTISETNPLFYKCTEFTHCLTERHVMLRCSSWDQSVWCWPGQQMQCSYQLTAQLRLLAWKKKQQLTQKPSQVSISVFPFTLSLALFRDLRPILSNLQKGITVDTNKFGHRTTNGIRNTYSGRKCTCSEVNKGNSPFRAIEQGGIDLQFASVDFSQAPAETAGPWTQWQIQMALPPLLAS